MPSIKNYKNNFENNLSKVAIDLALKWIDFEKKNNNKINKINNNNEINTNNNNYDNNNNNNNNNDFIELSKKTFFTVDMEV
jgi:hypothetical protein